MKRLALLFSAMVMMTLSINAQTDLTTEVPEQVLTAFEAKFMDASEVAWEMEDGNWEADFVLLGEEYESTFTAEGNWMRTDQEIEVEEVPATITSALELDVPGFEIDEVEIVETPAGKFYELDLQVGGKKMAVVTDLDGKILKKDAGLDDN